MTAEVELLREAARRLRAQAVDGNPNPWARPDMDRAIADWLDVHARDLGSAGYPEATDSPADLRVALRVAGAVMGREA